MLDHNNPWFCPVCRSNQRATKSLTVWRYPDFLIVHLKRFVYLEQVRLQLLDLCIWPLHMAFGTWHLTPGTWHLAPDIWPLHLTSDT